MLELNNAERTYQGFIRGFLASRLTGPDRKARPAIEVSSEDARNAFLAKRPEFNESREELEKRYGLEFLHSFDKERWDDLQNEISAQVN